VRRVRRYLGNRSFVLGCLIVGAFVALAVLAPLLAPPDDGEDPSSMRVVGKSHDYIPHPPTEEAILGTLPGQFDVYYTLVWGTRSALRFGLLVSLITAAIGTLLGAIGGFFGGLVQGLILRVTDAFLAFPVIAGVWLLKQVMAPASIYVPPTPIQQAFLDLHLEPVFLTLILLSWMPYARLTSANIVQQRQAEYVQAAVSLGLRNGRIIRRHLLPNALPPVLVLLARDVGAMVIVATAFTYIGLGSSTEWGISLVAGRDYVIGAPGNPLAFWWVWLPVTLALVLFGIGWNLIGDGLNTVLDPRIAR
jgi:peptide/nickel transport system permease protein